MKGLRRDPLARRAELAEAQGDSDASISAYASALQELLQAAHPPRALQPRGAPTG